MLSRKTSLLLASVVVNGVKQGQSAEDLLAQSSLSSWPSERLHAVVERLLKPFALKWKSGPPAGEARFPQVVNVDWRLDVDVKVMSNFSGYQE